MRVLFQSNQTEKTWFLDLGSKSNHSASWTCCGAEETGPDSMRTSCKCCRILAEKFWRQKKSHVWAMTQNTAKKAIAVFVWDLGSQVRMLLSSSCAHTHSTGTVSKTGLKSNRLVLSARATKRRRLVCRQRKRLNPRILGKTSTSNFWEAETRRDWRCSTEGSLSISSLTMGGDRDAEEGTTMLNLSLLTVWCSFSSVSKILSIFSKRTWPESTSD